MPEFAADFLDYSQLTATLAALLAGIGVLSLLLAGVFRMKKTSRKARFPRDAGGGRNRITSADSYADWNVEGGILFPTPQREDSHSNGHRPEENGAVPAEEAGRSGQTAECVETPSNGSRVVEAIRKCPIEFVSAAFGVGLATGLVLSLFADIGRQTRLLERLADSREQRRREQARHDEERFRQAQ